MLIAVWPRCPVICCQLNGGNDVQEQSYQHADAKDPNTPAMQHGMQEFSVMVKIFGTLVNEHVASHVSGKKQHKINASDGYNDFFADR